MDLETLRQKTELLTLNFTSFYNEVVLIFTDATYAAMTEDEKTALSETFKGYVCAMFKGLYGEDRLKALFETVSKEIYQPPTNE